MMDQGHGYDVSTPDLLYFTLVHARQWRESGVGAYLKVPTGQGPSLPVKAPLPVKVASLLTEGAHQSSDIHMKRWKKCRFPHPAPSQPWRRYYEARGFSMTFKNKHGIGWEATTPPPGAPQKSKSNTLPSNAPLLVEEDLNRD